MTWMFGSVSFSVWCPVFVFVFLCKCQITLWRGCLAGVPTNVLFFFFSSLHNSCFQTRWCVLSVWACTASGAFLNQQKTNTHLCLLQDVGCVSIELAQNRYVLHVSCGHNIVWRRCCFFIISAVCCTTVLHQWGFIRSDQDAVGCGLSAAVTGFCFYGEWNSAVHYNQWWFSQ